MLDVKPQRWSEDELRAAVLTVTVALGHEPTTAQYDQHQDHDPELPPRREFTRAFGSWDSALRSARVTLGLPDDAKRHDPHPTPWLSRDQTLDFADLKGALQALDGHMAVHRAQRAAAVDALMAAIDSDPVRALATAALDATRHAERTYGTQQTFAVFKRALKTRATHTNAAMIRELKLAHHALGNRRLALRHRTTQLADTRSRLATLEQRLAEQAPKQSDAQFAALAAQMALPRFAIINHCRHRLNAHLGTHYGYQFVSALDFDSDRAPTIGTTPRGLHVKRLHVDEDVVLAVLIPDEDGRPTLATVLPDGHWQPGQDFQSF